MKLDKAFYRLPLRFDVKRMQTEIEQFTEDDWRAHPSGYEGNSALILVSSNGEQNDSMDQPMLPTAFLQRCPYLQQVLAAFKTVVGRSRLMRLAPGAIVKQHCDVNYYWRTHTRIHVPIITHPTVAFTTRGETVHMQAGEAWTFDNWSQHTVINPSSVTRVHLVIDTIGTGAFWSLLDSKARPRLIRFDPDATARLVTERHAPPPVMPPAELAMVLRDVAAELDEHAGDAKDIAACRRLLANLEHDWASTWIVHGPNDIARPVYEKLLDQARDKLADVGTRLRLPSNKLTVQAVLTPIFSMALTTPKAVTAPAKPAAVAPAPRAEPTTPATPARKPATRRTRARKSPRFDRPLIIIAAPRSGSTLLYETLATHRNLFSVGGESHRQIEGIAALHPRHHDYASNRLTAADATPEIISQLHAAFAADLMNHAGVPYAKLPAKQRPASVRFLEKTPKNALRIPFLQAVFPDARFIYLTRSARDNLSSLLDSWRSGRYVTYKSLPGWEGPTWSHLLTPGWESLKGAALPEIVEHQWRTTHETILADLQALPPEQWCSVRYETLVNDTEACLRRLCKFAELPFGKRMQETVTQPLKPSRYTLTKPDPEKWRRNAAELEEILPRLDALDTRLSELGQKLQP